LGRGGPVKIEDVRKKEKKEKKRKTGNPIQTSIIK
jgi:hypothetical protein